MTTYCRCMGPDGELTSELAQFVKETRIPATTPVNAVRMLCLASAFPGVAPQLYANLYGRQLQAAAAKAIDAYGERNRSHWHDPAAWRSMVDCCLCEANHGRHAHAHSRSAAAAAEGAQYATVSDLVKGNSRLTQFTADIQRSAGVAGASAVFNSPQDVARLYLSMLHSDAPEMCAVVLPNARLDVRKTYTKWAREHRQRTSLSSEDNSSIISNENSALAATADEHEAILRCISLSGVSQ